MLLHAFAISLLAAIAQPATTPLSLRPCTVEGSTERVQCGDLLVPENPAKPDARHIKIHFVVIPALDPVAGRAPLFDLAGGPGLAATGSIAFYLTDGKVHRQNRDVVLVDQRGTGESSPLRCAELEQANSLAPMYPPEAVRRCRKTLERHADLSQYNRGNSVADLEAVRKALGYEKVDLFGLSYGTRLALTYIDLVPTSVPSAALMGVVPADAKVPLWHARNAQETLDALFADCAADDACASAYPRLREQWNRVVANPAFDGPAREAFRTLLGSPASQRSIPVLIQSMSGGDLTRFRERFATSDSGAFSEGLYLSIICAEDTHAISPTERTTATTGTFLGSYRIDEQIGACKEWKVPPRRLTYGAQQHDVPLLMIAGDRDYVTPVEWSRRVSAAATKHSLVIIPKLGHAPDGLSGMECLDEMLAAFYKRANTGDVNASCVRKMTPPRFTLQSRD